MAEEVQLQQSGRVGRRRSIEQATVADMLAEVITRGSSKKTRREYRRDLAQFLRWLDIGVELPEEAEALQNDEELRAQVNAALSTLQHVSETDINQYKRYMLEQGREQRGKRSSSAGLSQATVARRLSPLRLLFRRLQRRGLITLNPMDDVAAPQVANESSTVYLEDSELEQLERSLNTANLQGLRDRALLMFMVRTGTRSTETLSVDVADIARQGGHYVVWVVSKGGAKERVKLPADVKRLLDAYLTAAGITEGAVFRRVRPIGSRQEAEKQRTYKINQATEERLTYSGLYKIIKRCFAAANLDPALRPHSTRHTFITLALKHKATIAQAQAAARHRSPQTTMRYAHDMDNLDDHASDYVKMNSASPTNAEAAIRALLEQGITLDDITAILARNTANDDR